MKKKVVPKLRQEVTVIKIYYSGKFQDFTARYIINTFIFQLREYPCNITHDIYFLIYNE